ncbi:MAG TPA: sugar phosphate isomerase/epimerase [Thermomicrobiales bacterium]|jgi:sugar phosphate isomerase/epimerase|nr:sugar phosphate isomerase/epimerase [Thermomicrobiales bacterium]
MIPGIFTVVFPCSTPEQTFDAVASHGIRAVQYDVSDPVTDQLPDALPVGFAEQVGAAARERGVTIDALSGTFNMAHPDASRRADDLARFAVVAAAAPAMGAGVITLCTGTRDTGSMWREHPDNASPAAWADFRQTLDGALTIANQYDLTLAVECEPANVIRDAVAGRRLLDEVASDRLAIVMDPANILAGDLTRDPVEHLDAAFDLLGDRIVASHAKDIDVAGRFCPAGRGIVPWRHYVSLLREIDFDGPLVMHSLAEADVDECLGVLRSALA